MDTTYEGYGPVIVSYKDFPSRLRLRKDHETGLVVAQVNAVQIASSRDHFSLIADLGRVFKLTYADENALMTDYENYERI